VATSAAARLEHVVKRGDICPARQENEDGTVSASVAYALDYPQHKL
jgi:hypothetical protein